MACALVMPVYPSRRRQPPAGFRSAPSDAGKQTTERRLRCSSSCVCLSFRLDVINPAFKGFWIAQDRIFNDQFPQGIFAGDLRAANVILAACLT